MAPEDTSPDAELAQALERIAPGLLRYCFAKSLGDWHLAEDISQESLAALVRRWRGVGPPINPEAFCFGIARRRMARSLRRLRRLSPLADRIRDVEDLEPRPDEWLLREQEALERARRIRALPRRDREALLLVVAGGLDLKTAALTLGTTPGALKTRLYRARQKLREMPTPTSFTPQRSSQ
ncbi:MAG: sigma-70 family RNA polymerase sigma factor [Acidobacteriota bacterium]